MHPRKQTKEDCDGNLIPNGRPCITSTTYVYIVCLIRLSSQDVADCTNHQKLNISKGG